MRVDKKNSSVVRKNSTGSEYTNRRINFIEGSNVTLTVASDPTDNEVDVTIASSGGGGGVVGGSGVANKLSYWATASTLSTATGLTWDDANRRLGINSTSPGFTFETAGADSSANGAVAAWALKNTASGGGNWYIRTGATGTNTPAGGFSFANDSNYWAMFDANGKLGLGASVNNPPEQLSIQGRLALGLTTGASNASGYGKAYVKPDGNLYYLNPTGTEYALSPLTPGIATVGGSGLTNKLSYWSTASTLSGTTGLTYDATNQRLGVGNASPQHQLHIGNDGTSYPVVFGSTPTTSGAVSWMPNGGTPYFGIFDPGNGNIYGISTTLPSPQTPLPSSTIGGYYAGMGIGGKTNQGDGQPIFGILAANQSSNGPGNVAFTVYDTNRVADYHGFYNDSTGKMGLGITDSGILSERLNINGRLMMSFMTGVSNVSGFGKLYTKPDSQLYWLKSDGTEYALTPPSAGGSGSVGGSGQANKMTYWSTASTLSAATGLTYDAVNRKLGINTSSPTAALQIGGGGDIFLGRHDTVGGRLRMYYNTTDGYIEAYAGETYAGEQGLIIPQMRLTGGRFDFDESGAKAEIRVTGATTQINWYNKTNSNFLMQIESSDRSSRWYGDMFIQNSRSTDIISRVYNDDNGNGTAGAAFVTQVAGTSGGDPKFTMVIPATQAWSFGVDNSDSDKLKISTATTVGSGTVPVTMTTAGLVGIGTQTPATTLDIAGALRVSPVTLTVASNIATINAALTNTFWISSATGLMLSLPSNSQSGQKLLYVIKNTGGNPIIASAASGYRFGADLTSLATITSAKTNYIGTVYNGIDSRWDIISESRGY